MYFDPRSNPRPAGLQRSPFTALVVPRPIGWISTIDEQGRRNLAPFSFFGIACTDPPCVMFCPSGPHRHGGPLDTLRNVRETGEFVVNLADEALREQVVLSSATIAPGEDEFAYAGLDAVKSRSVAPPRVALAKAALECKLEAIHPLPRGEAKDNNLVIGSVVGIYIADEVIVDGLVDIAKLRPLSRLGYLDYAVTSQTFSMARPG